MKNDEARTILVIEAGCERGGLAVIAGDGEGRVWSHRIEVDGTETARDAADDTAAAARFREAFILRPSSAAGSMTPGLSSSAVAGRGGIGTGAQAHPRALAFLPAEPDDEGPFGPAFEARFSASAADLQEARRCLASEYLTAAAFHLGLVLEAGRRALARFAALPDGSDLGSLSRLGRGSGRVPSALVEALDRVRCCGGAPDLRFPQSFSAEEVALLLDAVGRFMHLLARHCDVDGNPVSETAGG